MKAAICGGGTGGHIHPLLALAEELASRDGVEVALFLSRKTPSGALPPHLRVIALDVSAFARSFDAGNLRALRAMAAALRACRREFRAWRPRVAVAFGGYASVPGALAALSLRVPLVLHEQNVIPGLANRMLAPFARSLAVSFRETMEYYPMWKRKGVLTGNPLLRRPGLPDEDPFQHFELEKGRKTLAVVGGSQGAASLNRAVLAALPRWRGRTDLQVVHSVGRDKYQEFAAAAAKVDIVGLVYRPLEFIERMDLLYKAADLVVCRAGASTVTELAAAGCAAILVPYPHATAAHQDANAAVLEKAGAAVVIADHELSGGCLVEEADRLLANAAALERMRSAALGLGKPGAAAELAELVLGVGGGG